MRLFVGAGIDPGMADALAEVARGLRGRAEAMAPRARLTWVPSDRQHFTLCFIGEADAAHAAAITAALAPPVTVPAFDFTIAGLGAFPELGTPRVLWAGVAEGRAEMIATEREVRGRLREFRLKAPATSTPHLTLARVREPGGLRTRGLFDGLLPTPIGPGRVGAITLFESRLSPKGPTYVALQRTALS